MVPNFKVLLSVGIGCLLVNCSQLSTDNAKDSTEQSIPATDNNDKTTPTSNEETKTDASDSTTQEEASLCADANLLLCLDFEDLSPGQTPQGTQIGANITVVNDTANSGTKSLRFTTNNSGFPYQSSYIRVNNIPGSHWGRIFYRVETVSNPAEYTHISFVAAITPDYEVRLVDTVRGPDATHQYLYNFSDDVGGKGSSYNWRFDDSWVCAEWMVDNTSQEYQFYRNGQLVEEISGSVAGDHTGIPQTYQWLGFGAQVYQNGPEITGWIDDVALSDSRIGCER